MTDDLPIVKSIKMIRSTKMVNGLLPDGTLIRACEVTFGYLEKQDDRIKKLEEALWKIADIEHEDLPKPVGAAEGTLWVILAGCVEVAEKALEGKDE